VPDLVLVVRGAQAALKHHRRQFRPASLKQESSPSERVGGPESKTVIDKVLAERATVFPPRQATSSSDYSHLLRSAGLGERSCLAPLHSWQHYVRARYERTLVVRGIEKHKMAAVITYVNAQLGRCMNLRPSPNSSLQRTASGIKCSAAGDRAPRAHERWRARVLRGWRAVAELGS
jgi:hypothetical protein